MNITELNAMISHLEELHARRDLAVSQYEQARDAILTDEQRDKLAAIEFSHEETMEKVDAAIKTAEEQVKAAVVAYGETVKGARLQAVWSKPRVSWDDKRLEEWFKAHDLDALDRMRKVGKASVSIRRVQA